MKTIKTYIAIAISLLTFSGMIAQNRIEEGASLNTDIRNRVPAADLINYQAVARNSSGELMTSAAITIDFEIRAGSGGGVIFTETQNLNTDANGVFSAQIGAVNSLSGIDWANSDPWLHLSLNGADVGETRMASVPYSFHAKYADYAETVADAVHELDDLTDVRTINDNTVYIGLNAGINDLNTDSNNVSVGYETLKANTIGFNNSAIGYQALSANTSGQANTGIGFKALLANTTGSFNVATGYNALISNTTGANNAAYGRNALYTNTTGIKNIANGAYSLFYNTTGSNNTASGYEALNKNTVGSNNSAYGSEALKNNIGGDWNTATGEKALILNSTGDFNTANGRNALGGNSTGSNNTAVGALAGDQILTGSNNTAIGFLAQVPSATNSNQVRIGNNLVTYAGVQVGWTITSDRRLKSNIEESNLGLNFIKALNPVVYQRKNDESKKAEYGFIAQEVEATLKEFGVTNNGIITIDDDGMYSVRYNDLIAVLTKAMQEQQEAINSLQSKVGSQESIIKDLTASLEQNVIETKDFDARLKQLETKL